MALTKEKIKEFEKTEKKAGDSQDFKNLANEIADAGDKDWAKTIYKKAEDKVESINEFFCLAESIDEKIADTEWVKTIYKKIEDKAETSSDLMQLADYIDDLGDKEWMKKIYKKAGDKSEDSHELRNLAQSIDEKLGESGGDLVRVIYKKAEEVSDNYVDLGMLAENIRDNLGDKKWATVFSHGFFIKWFAVSH